MALWDAFSGKILHWNRMRLEVHKIIYPRLQQYKAEEHMIRDYLFAGYAPFYDAFGKVVFGDDAKIRARDYAGRIKSVNAQGLMNLVSAYFLDHVVRWFSASDEDEGEDVTLRKWVGAKLMGRACLLYGKEDVYAAQRMAVFSHGNREMSAWLFRSEVALVLGLDPASDWDMAPSYAVQTELDGCTYSLARTVDWNDHVTSVLSKPPVFGD
ncbi:MAG: hypothetical protein GXY83_36930 [Rhodopirellula sp.]|nr:hypothetical protein [Rhodopirellula sp.]